MAIRPDNKPLRIGSVQSVEVEDVHDEVVMVCLKRNGKIYRGALINSPLGGCPAGLSSTPALCEKLNQEFPIPNDEPVVVIEPTANEKNDEAEKVQHSALSYRQSYFQGMPLPPPKPLLHSRKDEFREGRQKGSTAVPTRSRHIRLRPRQVLCSRCQSKCGQSTSVSHKNSSKNVKNMKNNITDKSRTLAKKRKMVNDQNSGVPRKKIKKGTNGDAKIHQQRSPIIKISYATPQGKGHVMRIPPRSQTNNKSAASSQKSSTQNGGGKHTLNGQQKNIKTAQKVLKNAKTKAQQKVAARSKTKIKVKMFNGFHSPKNNKSSSTDGHARKIRIIKSKGTYHSTTSQDTSSGSLKININNNNTKSEMKKTLGNVTVVATKLPSSLPNGHSTKVVDKKLIKQEKNSKKSNDFKSNNKEGTNHGKVNGLALPPHIPVKNSGYESSSECSNQSSKSSRSTKSSKSTKRSASQSSGEESDNQLVIVESNSAPQETSPKKVPPLNLRIHKKNVTKSCLSDGRVMCIGDIVWGKIIGFPWWPGRINEISVSRRDNGAVLEQEAQITWFAATTLSYMPLSKLYPFLQYFNSRYDRKKRGVYREAVRQASEAASSLSNEVRALNTMFETSQLKP